MTAVDPSHAAPADADEEILLLLETREAFLDAHGDLFTTGFWLDVQDRIRAGELPDLFPYPVERRLRAAT